MLPEIEKLLVLQDRDRKIRALKTELKLAPSEKKSIDEKLAASTKQLEAAKLKGKEIEVTRKNLENDVQSLREKIGKYNAQKFQTRKNEEYQALTNEITRFEGEIRAIEDRELELMESAEQQRATIADSEKSHAEVKSQVARQSQILDDKIAAIGAQLKDLEAERAKLAEAIDEDLLDTFTRLFNNKGDNAVCALEHGVCAGCHMTITAATSAKVRAGKEIAHCEQCGRILYWSE